MISCPAEILSIIPPLGVCFASDRNMAFSPLFHPSLSSSFLRNLPALKAADRSERCWPEGLPVCNPPPPHLSLKPPQPPLCSKNVMLFKVQGRVSLTFGLSKIPEECWKSIREVGAQLLHIKVLLLCFPHSLRDGSSTSLPAIIWRLVTWLYQADASDIRPGLVFVHFVRVWQLSSSQQHK